MTLNLNSQTCEWEMFHLFIMPHIKNTKVKKAMKAVSEFNRDAKKKVIIKKKQFLTPLIKQDVAQWTEWQYFTGQ